MRFYPMSSGGKIARNTGAQFDPAVVEAMRVWGKDSDGWGRDEIS